MKDSRGAQETPEQMFERVVRAVAQAEPREERAEREECFYELMTSFRFLPNSPTLMNAGKPRAQLSACFVLPVEDSLDGIFDTLKNAAKIHQSGGGTGFAFSRLRGQGSEVQSTHGVASGPVSFIRIYDSATETIKQGGTRRGANMAVLRVDHPDIVEFIDSKRDQRSILNFNISVGITTDFMSAVERDADFALNDPKTGRVVRELRARFLFERMVQSAWECGDPGLVFLDRINLFNPTPNVGAMESTNPCGEQPLLPYESCNLGSLNLGLYAKSDAFDWASFRSDIQLSLRFLDNVIDVNDFPLKESERITLRNRKVGLGVMGLADLLLMLRIPYDSAEARALGERVMSFLDREAKLESMRLARERGAFPNWKGSLWNRLGYAPMRNSTVSTVAPTGTISLIAGASSGIEPVFAGISFRNVLSGARLLDIHPAVQRVLRGKNIEISEESDALQLWTDERLGREIGPSWRPAAVISVDDHIGMQAAFQRHSDSAVSKTINLPESATPNDVAHAYRQAFFQGCKGITVFRDRSRGTQVLERPAPSSALSSGSVDDPNDCPSC
jgi:ribonucleoside-diphosphate reductase alpha chain